MTLLWISAVKTCTLSRHFYILEYTYLAFLPHHILIAVFSYEKVYRGNNTNVYRKFSRAKTQRVHYRTLLYSSCFSALSLGSLHNVNFEKLAFSESHSSAHECKSFAISNSHFNTLPLLKPLQIFPLHFSRGVIVILTDDNYVSFFTLLHFNFRIHYNAPTHFF